MTHHKPTVLVPVDASGEERPSSELLHFLSPTKVVVLGWYPVPDQTGTKHMQEERGDEAAEFIEPIVEELTEDGVDAESVVVFTRDREQTVDRIAEEYGSDVVLMQDSIERIERIFVPIRSDINFDRILPLVSVLMENEGTSVTLFHAAPEDQEDPSAGEAFLRGAAEELADLGVDTEDIETTHVVTDNAVDEIVDAAQNHDIIVIGETEPSLVGRILGDVPTKIIKNSSRPVLVVRDTENGEG